jgi:hypothetical protein
LRPESAVDAVRKVRPFGVESAPGKKDHAKNPSVNRGGAVGVKILPKKFAAYPC